MAYCDANDPWCPDCNGEALAAGSSAPACSPVWRKMTPEEYAAQYLAFGPHRATIECEVINEAASAAVSVCLLGFVDTANDLNEPRGK